MLQQTSAGTDIASMMADAAQRDHVIVRYEVEERDRIERLASKVVVVGDPWAAPPVTVVARGPEELGRLRTLRRHDAGGADEGGARLLDIVDARHLLAICSRRGDRPRSTGDVEVQTVKVRPTQPDPVIRDLRPQTETEIDHPQPEQEPEPQLEIIAPFREICLTRNPPEETHDEEQPSQRTDESGKWPMIMISTMRPQFSKTARQLPSKHSLAWDSTEAVGERCSRRSSRSIQNRPVANEAVYDGMN
jgi:hypothetical protein